MAGRVRQAQELVPGALVVAEDARGARCVTVRELCFSTPAHHHAEVGRLDDDADAAGLQHVHDRVGDLVGEPLLHLQPAGEHVHDARGLGEAEIRPFGM